MYAFLFFSIVHDTLFSRMTHICSILQAVAGNAMIQCDILLLIGWASVLSAADWSGHKGQLHCLLESVHSAVLTTAPLECIYTAEVQNGVYFINIKY